MSDKAVQWLMDRADKLGSFIDELAKQLGVAATHVYEVLVKQQYVEGVSLLVKSGITILLILLTWYLVNKLLFKKYEFIEDETGLGFLVWIIGAALAFATLLFAIDIVGDVTLAVKKLMNPEFYALETLMDFVKDQGGKK